MAASDKDSGRRVLFEVEKAAPQYRARAIDLRFKQGYTQEELYEDFCEQYGSGAVAHSSFCRWFKSVRHEEENVRREIAASKELLSQLQSELGTIDAATAATVQLKVLQLARTIDPEDGAAVLLKVFRELNRGKVIEIEREKWNRDKAREDAERAKKTKAELVKAGVLESTAEERVRRIYGIAS